MQEHSQTAQRKQQFCKELLAGIASPIGFVDVGSGGELKYPWDTLPVEHLRKFNFEPTDAGGSGLPLCISNHNGQAQFHVAHDERASSLHEPSGEFAERFGHQSIYTKKTLDVQCTTLDRYFEGKHEQIDLMDVNVEGHDFQALQGAEQLIAAGTVQLIKVEFELTEVWKGQGWFSDIDALLRAKGFDLADMEVEYARTVKAQHIFHRGEPLWGKGMYVRNAAFWRQMLHSKPAPAVVSTALRKAVALCVVVDLPGRAFDVLDVAVELAPNVFTDAAFVRERIAWVYGKARHDAVAGEMKRVGRFLTNMIK